MPHLREVVDRGGRVRVLTTDYLHGTQSAALQRLRYRQVEYAERFQVRVFLTGGVTSFHPKAYLLGDDESSEYRVGIVGSANASLSGLLTGVEWSLESRDSAALGQARQEFQRLWSDPRSVALSEQLVADWVDAPLPSRPGRPPARHLVGEPAEVDELVSQPVGPTPVQAQALVALESTRVDGYGAGLVVLATGLGRTWLAAFDSTRPQFRRVLFVAHREEILEPGAGGVPPGPPGRPDRDAGGRAGGARRTGGDGLDPDAGRSPGPGQPSRLRLRGGGRVPSRGRTDLPPGGQPPAAPVPAGADGHPGPGRWQRHPEPVPGQPGLQVRARSGLDRGLLSPFHYYGVPDPVDFAPLQWRNARFDPEALEHAVSTDQRAQAAFREWAQRRGQRTLAFCVSQRHAELRRSALHRPRDPRGRGAHRHIVGASSRVLGGAGVR